MEVSEIRNHKIQEKKIQEKMHELKPMIVWTLSRSQRPRMHSRRRRRGMGMIMMEEGLPVGWE